jgi:phospholipid-binding lipoprotein MlaA
MSARRLVAGAIVAAVSLQTSAAWTQVTSSQYTTVGTQIRQGPVGPNQEPNSQRAPSLTLPTTPAVASQLRIVPPTAPSRPPGQVLPDADQFYGGLAQPGSSGLGAKTLDPQTPPDPLAPLNHKVLKFNANVDDKAFHPVADGWARIMPKPARHCIHRFFDNVAFVPRFSNAMFQLKLKDAGGELARFGINSTVGMAGLFDPADKWFGLKEHDNDFGKTLAAWGMPGGWFVVMPVAGPVNVRNALGHFVDGALNPMNYLVPGSAEIYTSLAHSVEGLNERAENLDKFEGVPLRSEQFHPVALDSPDLYEAVRANFFQKENQKQQGGASGIGAATAGAATAGGAAGGAGQASGAAVGTAASGAAKMGE